MRVSSGGIASTRRKRASTCRIEANLHQRIFSIAQTFFTLIIAYFTLTCPDFEMLAMNGGSYLRYILAIPGRAATRIPAISKPVKFPDEK